MTDSTILNSSGNASSSGGILSALMSFLLKIGYFSTGLVGIVAALLYSKQESLLYFPEMQGLERSPARNPRGYRSPSEYNIPFESHMIRCEDGVNIHAWLFLQRNSKADRSPTILYFHGNAGNIGLRLPNAHQMFTNLKANILMVEYRGYGDSDSVKPTEKGLKLDAEAALNFIQSQKFADKIDQDRIFCFGRSLGGAVAFHLGQYSEEKKRFHGGGTDDSSSGGMLAGLIVENTFLSISKMVDQLMPFIAPLKFLVLRINWNSEHIAPRLSLPILYLAGERDELVPHNHMTELHALSGKASIHRRMHVIRNGSHNDSWMKGGKAYYEQIKAFTTQVMSNRADLAKQPSVSGVDEVDGTCKGEIDPSVEVSMGGTEKTIEMNAIPIMPTNIVSMAREAGTSIQPTASSEGDKKLK